MPKLIVLEFKKLKRSKILYIVVCTMFLFYLCAVAQGIKSAYSAERLMNETLTYATFLIAPALFSLLGSYIISREYLDDTMKSLVIVPINTGKLIYAKLIASLIIGLILFLILFIFSLISAFFVHADQVTVAFVFIKLKIFLLQGLGCFAVSLPIIVFTAMMKNGYWLSAIFAEIYSFTGLIAASSNYRNIYPVSAVFGFSGANPATSSEYFLCCLSLAGSTLVAIVILKLIIIFKSNSMK